MPGPFRQADAHAFLVLDENRLAVAALDQFFSKKRHRSQRLLTIIGPAGSGKSHLVHQALKKAGPLAGTSASAKRVQVTASEFAAQFAEASDAGTERQFQLRHRQDVQLLVVEDIQALVRRTETQRQLTAAIDDVIAQNGLCLLTSSTPVGEIPRLFTRLVNRVHGGVTAHVDLPATASRVKLLQHFANANRLSLTEDAAQLIAGGLSTPRELLGIVHRLRQSIRTARARPLSVEDVSPLIETAPLHVVPSLEEVARTVAREFGVTVTDLRGSSRSRGILIPRQLAMYLGRDVSQATYVQIGRFFGGRNHNTALYACRRIESLIAVDPRIMRRVELVTVVLKEPGREWASKNR